MKRALKEASRDALAACAAILLRAFSRPFVPGAGPALVVAPHADDETLGCGGILAAGARSGRTQRVVFLTDGAASHPGHPRVGPVELSDMRRAEAILALQDLGIGAGAARFLGEADGSLERLGGPSSVSLVRRLADLIRELAPAEVFVTWRGDGSSEHRAAYHFARSALALSGGGTLMEYPVWAWWDARRFLRCRASPGNNLRFRLGELRSVKRSALERHRSQVSPLAPWTEPVLPGILARSCCGPHEFFFRSRVPSGTGLPG